MKLNESPPHRKTWINLTNLILSQKDMIPFTQNWKGGKISLWY